MARGTLVWDAAFSSQVTSAVCESCLVVAKLGISF